MTTMPLKSKLEELLADRKPSAIVQALAEICAERASVIPPRSCSGCGVCPECAAQGERIGWEETTAALEGALDRITSYGK